MKTKQTSASVIKFLDGISKNVLSNISIENYFSFKGLTVIFEWPRKNLDSYSI